MRFWRVALMLGVLNVGAVVGAEPSVQISAVDSQGNRIESFEAMLAVGNRRQTQWYPSKQGRVRFESYDLKSWTGTDDEYIGATEVFIRSPGYATESQKFSLDGDEKETSLELALDEGRRVTVTISDESGRRIPEDLHPLFLPSEYRRAGLYRWQQDEGSQFRRPDAENWYGLQFVKPGQYSIRVTDRTPDLYLNIDDYDFLRCYESGPHQLADHASGDFEVVLPTPGSVRARFRIPEDIRDLPMSSLVYSASRPMNRDGGVAFPIYFERLTELDSELSIDHLAPGQIHVGMRTNSKRHVEYGETDPGVFRDRELVDLQPGETHSSTFTYRAFSPEPFKGKNDVLLKVSDRLGSPAEGKRYRIEYDDLNFGRFVVKQGTIESGGIELSGLVAAVEGEEFPARYALYVNERSIGRFAVGDRDQVQVESFVLAPDVGDAAVELNATSLRDGEPVNVSFKGHVTLLEFWATWCGPCQMPMNKLNKIAREKAADWQDRVQLIALSIDDQRETVQHHVESRNWTNLDVFVDLPADPEVDLRSSLTAKSYLVSGVPTAILIDNTGTIVFRGHPDSLDLVTRVDELLQKK